MKFHKNKKITIIFIVFGIFMNFLLVSNIHIKIDNSFTQENPQMSWFWATLDLTNPGEVNNSMFTHYTSISVKGRLYNKIDGSNKSGVKVAIEIDDVVDGSFTDTTDFNGRFNINYIIDGFLDVYSSHKIEVFVTDFEPGGPGSEIEYHHFYNVYINATSDFDIITYDDLLIPKLTGEDFNVDGYLRYDNGNGIPFEIVNYYWLDGISVITGNAFSTDDMGSLNNNYQIPDTSASQLALKFNYSNSPFVGYSEKTLSNIKVFSDVAWNLNYIYTTTEGADYTLSGILSSGTDSSLRIRDRVVNIYLNGSLIATETTDSNGRFASTFVIPDDKGNGTAPIYVELDNSIRTIRSTPQIIVIEPALELPQISTELPPFLLFSLIFFPILIGIIAVLTVYGYRRYRKQEEESRVVNIPLESKIRNLKILKDSGRLEESLSYLFNAIYMDLVNAKYGRMRRENETIRDFAIISVKELKLTPSSIYPFIQQVEEIIYGKPFKITEKDFYQTCELFSPIYFQLTGYNFVLNF
ncbi:MAG: hypothetical protein ACFFCI_09945 [Promethearchaeota archaeon]